MVSRIKVWIGCRGSGRLRSIIEWAIVAAIGAWFLYVVGLLDFGRYLPPRGTSTIDQLVAQLPKTLKFATVEQGGRSYVVWIGRMRPGAIDSGPPVYVFDRNGVTVDRVLDVGDSGNKFVEGLYEVAFHSSGITPQQAVDYCRKWRAASR